MDRRDGRRIERAKERETGEYLFGGIIFSGVTERRSNKQSFEITAFMYTSHFIYMSKQFAKVFKKCEIVLEPGKKKQTDRSRRFVMPRPKISLMKIESRRN